ncbi:MAG TPA: P-loop NTPase [Anaeromyxobacteraceae bacterium]|nr:P-loop NTPase [Anaeromyxobacteraceae bacterium]
METQHVLIVGMAEWARAALAERLGPEVSCQALPRPPLPGEPLGRRPSAVLVSLEPDAAAAFAFVSRLTADGIKAVVVGPRKDADLILRAMRAGASEFVVAAEPDHVLEVTRAMLLPAGGAELGTVTTVFAPKGGVGATTLAVNLAGALERRGEPTCLLDLDLEMGDVLTFLDLSSSYGIADVVANLHRLDRDLLESSLPRHRAGFHVLAQSNKIEDAEAVDAPALGRLLDFLRRHFRHVVVDGVRGFGDLPLAALDASHRVLLVVTQEIPAVRNARRCVELFRRLGYGSDRVRLVVNRHQRKSRIPDDLLAQTAGLEIAARVGNDYPLVDRSIHAGELVADGAGRSSLARDLLGLVDLVVEPRQGAVRATSLLQRVFAGRVVPDGA